ARSLGLRANINPRWGELQLQAEDQAATAFCQVMADPTGVDMDRVAATMRAVEDIEAGKLAPDAARSLIGMISRAPPARVWLFMLAAGAGAVALAVIFGIQHVQ